MSKLEFNELTIAPTFKDLLQAIVDERRKIIKNTDFYKYIEKSIRAKCEEAARDLNEEICLRDLYKYLISNELFNTLGAKFSANTLNDTIKCICNDLGLDYKDGVISWG